MGGGDPGRGGLDRLRPLPLRERRPAVLDAIHAAWPPPEAEQPNPPDAAVAAAVTAHAAAVLLHALAGLPDPCEDTRRLLEGWRDGRLVLPAADPGTARMGGFARRLYGPRGATVRAEG